MSLVLEIEFLTGVCRAARGVAADAPDWPPQPDRVFSALVAAWADLGAPAPGRAALEWLEGQPAPLVHASGYEARNAPEVFVPPNDMRASSAAAAYLRILPDRRPRQPRRFPAARPHDPVMRHVWAAAPPGAVLGQLDALARNVGYLGHSASLVRCRFSEGEPEGGHPPVAARARIYPGRLEELAAAYAANPVRPVIPAAAAPAAGPRAAPAPAMAALVLEAVGGVPDVRAAAAVCRRLRRALMSGYRRASGEASVPEEVSGHAGDGRPSERPHLAVHPVVRVENGGGGLLGFVLFPPRRSRLLGAPAFRRAFREIARFDEDLGRRVLTLTGRPPLAPVRLCPADADTAPSLGTGPYLGPARVWASVTPVVLDRHLKGRGEREVRELVASACGHAGLPRPAVERIQVGRHSPFRGVPPARPSRGEPPWTAWRVPPFLATRSLVHAVVDFGRDVEGPVFLGAGRYTGLGLMRALGG